MGSCKKKNKYKQSGYTLIELLLVVAVLSLIAALGVKTYRDKSESDRVNIAALNLQHVLESGIAYNAANKGLWPKNNWNPCNSTAPNNTPPQDDNFVKNYLPNESNQSNFGVPVCWSGDGDSNDVSKKQKANRFWAAVTTGTDTNAINLAKRIAARLPNAIITNDPNKESSTPTNTCDGTNPCFVKAVVAMPAGSGGNAPTYVAGMGYCDGSVNAGIDQQGWDNNVKCIRTTLGDQFGTKAGNFASNNSLGQYAIKFSCNTNETPSVYITPNYLQMERSSTQTSPMYEIKVASHQDADGNTVYADCDPLTADGQAKCVITLKATFGAIAESGKNWITDVGCTDDYDALGLCLCPRDANGNSNCKGGGTVRPGYVGASYTAVCSSEASKTMAANRTRYFW
jgi:prepilin-type N-terminal cleavage/methylation domain-containing protein